MKTKLTIAALLVTFAAVGTARADEWVLQPFPDRTMLPDTPLSTPMGTNIAVGGGVEDFLDDEVESQSDVAGSWGARVVIGSRSAIAGEVEYIGAAQQIDALGVASDAALVRNGVTANLRLGLPFTNGPWAVTPYALGGLGWSRFDLINEGRNTSSIRNEDDVFTIPVGAGISAGYNRFTMDARYAFYPTFDDELLRTPTGSTDRDAGLDHWNINLMLGYEF